MPHFSPVVITLAEWRNPRPEREGERIVWRDGSLHGSPEDDTELVTVMRRASSDTRDAGRTVGVELIPAGSAARDPRGG